jgi:arsenate reductase
MAEAFGRVMGLGVFECFSAGTEKRDIINQDAVRIMKEIGIDMEFHQRPKMFHEIPEPEIVITMGCNVDCPAIPCCHREDWGLDDPSGKSDADFRVIRDSIKKKMEELVRRIKCNII